jgi:uncharacterized membrane protein YhiD involved in acid resistance
VLAGINTKFLFIVSALLFVLACISSAVNMPRIGGDWTAVEAGVKSGGGAFVTVGYQ